MANQFQFEIAESYSPATLPMERLAEYLAAFAKLLGEPQHVHFGDVVEGSAVLRANVDEPAQPKVLDRVRAVRSGDAPADALKAFRDLDDMLRLDNAVGALRGDGIVIPFPGKNRPEPLIFGPFRQDGTLDGQVFRIGGKDESKHVHIRDAGIEFTQLVTTEEVALRLRHYVFGPVLRFSGQGSWVRHGDGRWELRSFRVTDFEELDDQPLADVVSSLRKVRGSEWPDVADPVQALLEDRRGEETAH